jgi:ribose 5-phosphate isomerase B
MMRARLRVALGCDEVGEELKEAIGAYLGEQTAVPVECATVAVESSDEVDAPEVAAAVAEAIARGEFDRGILVCGSGVGMAIAANKVPGVRAAQCHDPFTAEHARTSNDAQILVMGSRAIGLELAKRVVAAWLAAEFQETPRRLVKMAKLDSIERRFLRDSGTRPAPG